MVAEQVEAESTCSCPQLRFSADLPTSTEQSTESQLIGSFEAKEYRSRLVPSRLQAPHPMRKLCRTVRPGSRSSLLGAYPQEKKGRCQGSLSELFSARTRCTDSLGPISLKPAELSAEIGVARGIQGHPEPWLLHRTAISTKQERVDLLTQISPSHGSDS